MKKRLESLILFSDKKEIYVLNSALSELLPLGVFIP